MPRVVRMVGGVGRSGESCGFRAEAHVVSKTKPHVAEGRGATTARGGYCTTCPCTPEVGARQGSHGARECGVPHGELV